MIGRDEEGTLRALRSHRTELIDPLIAEFGGRIANTAGDSLLLEFPSAVEAVRCAIAVQEGMARRNAEMDANERIIFRMGVNVGDVVAQDDDLLGDGVNIAARLEGLAEPGGINLSAAAYEQIGERIDASFEDLGDRNLKNIAKPVRVYCLRPDGAGLERPSRRRFPGAMAAMLLLLVLAGGLGGALWWFQPWRAAVMPDKHVASASIPVKANRPAVAVLPFTNMSGDKEQDYFSDGMTEDLTTDLSKISSLMVISRTSTSAYKDTAPDIKAVAKELNVRYVVEGSVRKAGGKVRINAQLIDAQTGENLWAERYDRDYQDIFALQDEVRGKIISALAIKLAPDEERRLARPMTHSPEAYDFYLKALKQESFFTKEANLKSVKLFGEAIRLDPSFAAAYAHLAQAYSLQIENHWADRTKALKEKTLKTALKGIELDDESPYAYWSLGRIYTRPFVGDPEKAKAAFEKAISLNPNYADGYMQLAFTLIFTGNAPKALPLIEQAMQNNPHYPFWYLQGLSMAQFFAGNFETSVKLMTAAIERNPNVPWLHQYLIASYGALGRKDDADWEMSEIEALGQQATIKAFMKATPLHDPGYRKIYENALRKAGMPEG